MMAINLLARFIPPDPTQAALVESMRSGLEAERHVVKLQRSLDVQTGIARFAHERIDKLSAALAQEMREHQATRRLLSEAQAGQAQTFKEKLDLAEQLDRVEGDMRPLQLRCEVLADQLRVAKARKGKR